MSVDNVNKTGNPGSILEPGVSIKPCVNTNLAIKLIKENFGYDVVKIKQLNSYDDVNYLVEVNDVDRGSQKFVFKVLNSMDSQKTGHIEAQHEVMSLLKSRGINCPVHQKTVQGKIYALAAIPAMSTDDSNNPDGDGIGIGTRIHLIRLLSFVDGDLLANTKLTEPLLRQAGAYIAQVEQHLKGFHHNGLDGHSSVWFLSSTPELRKFLYVLDDQVDKQKLVLSVLEAFERRVVPAYSSLEQGIIHGDFNEQNILCLPSDRDSDNESVIHGLIDFGDINFGRYLFELAITICYIMLECVKPSSTLDPFVGSAHVLAGYSSVRKVPELELDLLRTCIASRLCVSLVMGAYTYSQDPGNVYLLTTAKTGWSLLDKVWNGTDDDSMKKIWKNVIAQAHG